MIDFKARFASSVVRPAALFLGISFVGIVHGQAFQPVEGGPIHEAFVTPVTETVTLEAIEAQPPPPIMEQIPPQPGPDVEWVAGYWVWAPERKDFLWVSGVWRRPPPGMHWISGVWKHYDEGWVRIQGFWSREPADSLTTIDIAPPDQIDEAVPLAPGNGFFWMSGYWEYSMETRNYAWRSGCWVVLDPNLILVPAHYVWRPGGYVFVPSYWDWPIEQRGRAYATVYVPPPVRMQVIYRPVVIIEPEIIVQSLFVYYPDYCYFFHHHHHYHPDFWIRSGYAPPWWGWDRWWCFTWHDHWAVWWWYTHPGYPHPAWITAELANRIPPPSRALITKVKIINAPTIVTVRGVMPPHKILQAAVQNRVHATIGATAPILPADPKRVEKIKNSAMAEEFGASRLAANPLRPTGTKSAQIQQKGTEKQTAPAKPTTTPTTTTTVVKPPIKQPSGKPSESAPQPSEPRLLERENREPNAKIQPPIRRPVSPAPETLREPVPQERPAGYRVVEPPTKPVVPRGFEQPKPALRENERPQASPAGPPSRQLTSPPTPPPAEPNTDEKGKLK